MLQVAALEIIHSEFHFTLTQSKYRLEAREGGLGELMKPWGKRIVFRKKNVMGIQTDGRVKFAPFYSASCSGRIFWKLEWRSSYIYIWGHYGSMRKTVFPQICIMSGCFLGIFLLPSTSELFTHLHLLLGCSAVGEESGSNREATKDGCYEHCYTIPNDPLATWCQEPTVWKRPWCWERWKAGGEGDDRGRDGWMASPTR